MVTYIRLPVGGRSMTTYVSQHTPGSIMLQNTVSTDHCNVCELIIYRQMDELNMSDCTVCMVVYFESDDIASYLGKRDL